MEKEERKAGYGAGNKRGPDIYSSSCLCFLLSEWVVLSFSLFFRVKSLLYLVYHIRIVIRLSSPSDRQALYTASQARRLRYHDCANRLVANIVDGSKHDGGLR